MKMTGVIGNKIQSKMIELKTEDPSRQCDFCKKAEIKTQWGGFYCLEDVTVHYFCLLFSSGLHQNGEDHEGILGFLVPDIKKEIRRGKKLRCKYCKQSGATVGCAIKKCKSSFHYTCGLPKGTLNCFVDQYESYCPVHKPVSRIPDDLEDYECILCMSDLLKDEYPVWSPCCKTRVFHRECIQAYAYSAGYYHFKCPHCNSKKKFRKAMQKSGIYVPVRDAAWETEPNAFADLNQVYSSCDARRCLCPKGKDFQDNSKWKIYRCTTCGGSAIHQRCGKVNSTKWICTDCFAIVGEGSLSRHQAAAQSDSCSDEESGEGEEICDNQMNSSLEPPQRNQAPKSGSQVGTSPAEKNDETRQKPQARKSVSRVTRIRVQNRDKAPRSNLPTKRKNTNVTNQPQKNLPAATSSFTPEEIHKLKSEMNSVCIYCDEHLRNRNMMARHLMLKCPKMVLPERLQEELEKIRARGESATCGIAHSHAGLWPYI